MSTLTEQVAPAELRKGDLVTLIRDGQEVFAGVRRVTALEASDRILVDYYLLAGALDQDNTGTADLGRDDLIQRVPEREAKPVMAATAARVQPSSAVACPVCKRPPGLCCVNERGAVRRAGLHRERTALERQAS